MKARRPKQRRHIPLRTCVVCRQKKEKRQLIRLVYSPDAGLQPDPSGKRTGRGAYLCRQLSCWDKALNSQVLDKALRATLSANDRQTLAASKEAFLTPLPPAPEIEARERQTP